MNQHRTTLIGTILTLSVGLLVGCGTTPSSTTTNQGTTNTVNNTKISGTTQSQNTSSTGQTSKPSNTASTNGAGKASATGNSTAGQGTSKVSPPSTKQLLTLENVQVTDTGIILITTHGAMQTAYANPHLTNGNPQQFVIVLRNMSPGKFPVGQATTFSSGCVKSMQLQQSGNNLMATFTLKQKFSSFNLGIGGGTEIGVTFKA